MNRTRSPDSFTLQGKVVVLTGGAGIYGRGLATQIAHAGATLVLASRNHAALTTVAEEEQRRGNDVYAYAFDQGDETSILQLRDQVLRDFGRVDGLVNNAVARPMTSFNAPVCDWEASMKINATGLFALTRALGEIMAAAGSGSIVNVASIQGLVGPSLTLYEGLELQALPDYFFHKGGMINLTRFFAAHFGPKGVRVNSVSPGGFLSGQPAEFVRRYEQSTFLRRMADERDLGGPVVFLLSEAARYVTGANLPVDGGYTAH